MKEVFSFHRLLSFGPGAHITFFLQIVSFLSSHYCEIFFGTSCLNLGDCGLFRQHYMVELGAIFS